MRDPARTIANPAVILGSLRFRRSDILLSPWRLDVLAGAVLSQVDMQRRQQDGYAGAASWDNTNSKYYAD